MTPEVWAALPLLSSQALVYKIHGLSDAEIHCTSMVSINSFHQNVFKNIFQGGLLDISDT